MSENYLRCYFCLLLSIALPLCAYSYSNDYDEDDDRVESAGISTLAEVCVPRSLGGVEWILSVKNSDYGWGDETHRAIIALALNKWKDIPATEIRQMELQLDVEITKSLLRNRTLLIHPNDLVLHIHALIAARRNPRAFYGNDLVALLIQFADASAYGVNPFILLALCNTNAATEHHLHYAKSILKNQMARNNNIDLLALALYAYSCMKTMKFGVEEALIKEAQNSLLTHQSGDGSFGNLYTTSLVVQALTNSRLDWDNDAALSFLRRQSTVNPNMVSTYLIELALNSKEFPFIKNMHPGLSLEPVPVKREEGHFIQYTVRVGNVAEVYFTITLLVPKNSTFFDVMKISSQHDSKFNFSYYYDNNHHPSVYSISGVPNDAEGNRYWRLCLQTDIDHDRHVYRIKTIHTSPALLIPKRDDHVLYWFRDSDCGEKI